MVYVQERSTDPDENIRALKALEEKFYGSNILRKADADASTASPAYSTPPDFWNPIFGRKVWSALNYEENVFSIIPKEPWVNSGWRVVNSAPLAFTHTGAELAGGIAREGTLPETISSVPVVNSVQPKEIMHTFASYEIYDFLSSVDDSVAIMPFLREEVGKNHVAVINRQLVQSAEYLAGNSGANWLGTNNFESLDRLIASGAEETAVGGSHTTYYDPWVKYGTLAVDRDAGTTYDAVVKASGGTLGTDGDLNLWGMENVWREIREAGGNTDVILTGADFISALSEILEPERRFVGEAKVVPSYGGVRGLGAGTEGAFIVSTYRGIPMITSNAVRCTDATYGDTISKAYFLETQYLRMKMAAPTRYLESERNMTGFVAHDKLRVEAGYLTVGELLAYRFNTQGKLRDIK